MSLSHFNKLIILLLLSILYNIQNSFASPPKLSIFHFDVNTGDSTLIISPDGKGVLIDAGDKGRGKIPIMEFLNRAKKDGVLKSLDYTVATHYDADHIGGMDELYRNSWYPEIAAYDRGNSNLRTFDPDKLKTCSNIDIQEVENLVDWESASAPSQHCNPKVTCQIAEYFLEAEKGGKRKTLNAGDVIELDHGLEIVTLVSRAVDIDGDEINVYFDGRRKDCADNDLSIGLLVKFGDFRYLVAGDLTGDESQDVADIENLIKDNAKNLDVYHINHHGSKTSSSENFMSQIKPSVVIVSNGKKHNHPHKDVIEKRILSLNPPPDIYLTNRNKQEDAWKPPDEFIADKNFIGYDGTIQIDVWRRSYRVTRWRDGSPLDIPGRKYLIKER